MTELTTILDEPFLEFLQNSLTELCKGKMSVVFEDLQSIPITTKYPILRVFASRDKCENVCKTMIDCRGNEAAKVKCLLSDKSGATVSKTSKRGYLYRCHHGRGFPNFLFPIKVWGEEVVGYLYVGQFAFGEMENSEKEKLRKRLRESGYRIENLDSFVADWSEADIYAFWEWVIDPPLRKKFPYKSFRKELIHHIRYYGVTTEEFFDVIETIEGLANELSKLGNSLYTLRALVELEDRLSPFLWAKHDFDLCYLRHAVRSMVSEEPKEIEDIRRMIETISDKSLGILLDVKNYEDKYLGEAFKPFRLKVIKPEEKVIREILEYYIRKVTFETIIYSRIRSFVRHNSPKTATKGDEILRSVFNLIACCGKEFPRIRELVLDLFLKMHREKETRLILTERLIPCARVLFENDSLLQKWLTENGITDLRVQEFPQVLECFSRPLDVMINEFDSISKELTEINKSAIDKLKKKRRRPLEFLDIGQLSEYVWALNSMRRSISKRFLSDKFGVRGLLDLKAYRVFLNSGGLNPVLSTVVNAERRWATLRDEEGPVGIELEKQLAAKIENTRELIAKMINAESSCCVLFTENTTSSIDLVLRGLLKGGDQVLTVDLEHDVVFHLLEYYQEELNVDSVIVPIKDAVLKGENWFDTFTSMLSDQTRLIIISHIFFSTGAIPDIRDLIRRCREISKQLDHKVFILVDGAQAFGNTRVNVKDLDCDFYAFDGHKWFLGPEGSGLLYCKEEYLDPESPSFLNLPVSTMFRMCPKFARKDKELGTIDASKIIGLGAAAEFMSKLKLSDALKWRRHLVNRFIKSMKTEKLFKILDSRGSLRSGIVVIQLVGHEKNCQIYEDIVNLLQKSNIVTRSLKNPAGLRLCFHCYNSEADVDIASFHLKGLIRGLDIHRGDFDAIKTKIKELVKPSLKPRKKARSYAGLCLFSPPGAGKSYVIKKLLRELKRTKIVNYFLRVKSKDILKLPEREGERKFASILEKAHARMPVIIFLDEADSLLACEKKGILGVFNEECNRISDKRETMFFIMAVNDPTAICKSAARRFKFVYFPLPDLATRSDFFRKKTKVKNLSSDILLREMSQLTDGYTMSDLNKLWESLIENAGDAEIRPRHFKSALESARASISDTELKRYEKKIDTYQALIFTGQLDVSREI